MERKDFPDIHELQRHFKRHDIHISERTVKRDFQSLRSDFGIEIAYDSHKRGYHIIEEMSLNIDQFMNFLDFTVTANLMINTLSEAKENLNYISFSFSGSLINNHYLTPLLEATKNHKIITFSYEKFSADEVYQIELSPMLLREYEYRWYVIGYMQPVDEHRTFAVDRISDLKVLEKQFEFDTRRDLTELFDDIIGLNYSTNELTTVRLRYNAIQAKYAQTLPLHYSQKVISKSPNSLIVELHIKPNLEFRQQLLKLGNQVEVLEPKWLRDEIKTDIESALKNYS